MNRLILVGNGFDLAHGYKTNYTDFILEYLKECCINATNNIGERKVISRNNYYDNTYTHEDRLIRIKLKNKYTNIHYEELIRSCNNLSQLFDLMDRYEFTRYFKSLFFKESINHCEKLNWVDIENQYFQQLLIIKQNYSKNKEKYKSELIDLNLELDFLILRLEKYLNDLKIQDDNDTDIEILCDIITSPINKSEVVSVKLNKDIKPSNIYILNFNYTPTTDKYYKYISNQMSCDTNQIHGELNNEKNPIIFGFGDELDKVYSEIEELNENEYFKHIKSFKYFFTSKYHELIRFIESNYFQVYIMGHSCGLSDRTLLNQIFEHDNCKSIKIFYYLRPDGTNDFTDKTFEISRQFKDKVAMRKKIVPFEKSVSMIQLSNII